MFRLGWISRLCDCSSGDSPFTRWQGHHEIRENQSNSVIAPIVGDSSIRHRGGVNKVGEEDP